MTLDDVVVGQPIWGTYEADGTILIRLDCGDMGALRLTQSQAGEIVDSLKELLAWADEHPT